MDKNNLNCNRKAHMSIGLIYVIAYAGMNDLRIAIFTINNTSIDNKN